MGAGSDRTFTAQEVDARHPPGKVRWDSPSTRDSRATVALQYHPAVSLLSLLSLLSLALLRQAIAPIFVPPSPSLLQRTPVGKSIARATTPPTVETQHSFLPSPIVSRQPPRHESDSGSSNSNSPSQTRDPTVALFFGNFNNGHHNSHDDDEKNHNDDENKENIPPSTTATAAPIDKQKGYDFDPDGDHDDDDESSQHFLSINTSLDLPEISDEDDPFFSAMMGESRSVPSPVPPPRCTFDSLDLGNDVDVDVDADAVAANAVGALEERDATGTRNTTNSNQDTMLASREIDAILKELNYHTDVTPEKTKPVKPIDTIKAGSQSPEPFASFEPRGQSIQQEDQTRLDSFQLEPPSRMVLGDITPIRSGGPSKYQEDVFEKPATVPSPTKSISAHEKMRRALDAYYEDRAAMPRQRYEEQLHEQSAHRQSMAWLEDLARNGKKVVINDNKTEVRLFQRTTDERDILFNGKTGMRKTRSRNKSKYAAPLLGDTDPIPSSLSPSAASDPTTKNRNSNNPRGSSPFLWGSSSSSSSPSSTEHQETPLAWATEFHSALKEQIHRMGESSWMLKDSLAQWTEEFLENEKYSSQRDWFICKGEGGQQPGTSGTAPTGTGSIAASSEGPTKADRARGFPNLMSCTSNTPEITRTYSSPPICLASSNSFSDSGSVGSIQSESALHMASFRRPLRRNHSNGSGNSELPRRASKSAPSQDVLIEASTYLASDGSVWSLGEKSDAIEMSLVETKPRPHIPVEHKRAVVESARRWAAINNPASVTANGQGGCRVRVWRRYSTRQRRRNETN